MSKHRVVTHNCTSLLPKNWTREVEKIANERSKELLFDGSISTSRHTDNEIIRTKVVHGGDIADSLPWLYTLYTHEFLEILSSSHDINLICSPDLKSSININLVHSNGGGYEKHVDTNHVTGILFVTDTTEIGAGDLQFHIHDRLFQLACQQGTMLSFSDTTLDHSVSNRLVAGDRITVVMNYYDEAIGFVRPEDLNSQIY